MCKSLVKQYRKRAYKLVFFQVLVSIFIACTFFILSEISSAYFSALGSSVVVISNFIFATFAFSYVGGSQTDKVLKGFYQGEALKLLLIITLLTVIFLTQNVLIGPFFAGYIGAFGGGVGQHFLFLSNANRVNHGCTW